MRDRFGLPPCGGVVARAWDFTGRTGGREDENAFLFLEDQNQKYFLREKAGGVEPATSLQTRWRQRVPQILASVSSSRPPVLPVKKSRAAQSDLDPTRQFLRFRLHFGSPHVDDYDVRLMRVTSGGAPMRAGGPTVPKPRLT